MIAKEGFKSFSTIWRWHSPAPPRVILRNAVTKDLLLCFWDKPGHRRSDKADPSPLAQDDEE